MQHVSWGGNFSLAWSLGRADLVLKSIWTPLSAKWAMARLSHWSLYLFHHHVRFWHLHLSKASSGHWIMDEDSSRPARKWHNLISRHPAGLQLIYFASPSVVTSIRHPRPGGTGWGVNIGFEVNTVGAFVNRSRKQTLYLIAFSYKWIMMC